MHLMNSTGRVKKLRKDVFLTRPVHFTTFINSDDLSVVGFQPPEEYKYEYLLHASREEYDTLNESV